MKDWNTFPGISWDVGDRVPLEGKGLTLMPDSFPILGMRRERPAGSHSTTLKDHTHGQGQARGGELS